MPPKKRKAESEDDAPTSSKKGKRIGTKVKGKGASSKVNEGVGSSEERGGKVESISIEHCTSWQVYKKKANEYVSFLLEEFPGASVELNQEKPRRQAFNISVKVLENIEFELNLLVWFKDNCNTETPLRGC